MTGLTAHPATCTHGDIAQDFAAFIVPHAVARHVAKHPVPARTDTPGPVFEPQQPRRALARPLVNHPVHQGHEAQAR